VLRATFIVRIFFASDWFSDLFAITPEQAKIAEDSIAQLIHLRTIKGDGIRNA
jgi:hypothetical protein